MQYFLETYMRGRDIKVRPLPGQGLDTAKNVQCERMIRESYPVGTVFSTVSMLDMGGFYRADRLQAVRRPDGAWCAAGNVVREYAELVNRNAAGVKVKEFPPEFLKALFSGMVTLQFGGSNKTTTVTMCRETLLFLGYKNYLDMFHVQDPGKKINVLDIEENVIIDLAPDDVLAWKAVV